MLPKPAVDLRALKQHANAAKQNVLRRKCLGDVDRVLELNEAYFGLKRQLEALQQHRNHLSGQLKDTSLPSEQRQPLIQQAKSIKVELSELQASTHAAGLPSLPLVLGAEAAVAESALMEEALKLPNQTHPAAPTGSEGRVLATHGSQDSSGGAQALLPVP